VYGWSSSLPNPIDRPYTNTRVCALHSVVEEKDICETPPIKNGYLEIPSGPGLGAALNEENQ